MRLVLTAAALALAALATPAAAQTGAPGAPPEISRNNAPTGQPPFGGDFASRIDRLGADVKGGVRHGWLTAVQADKLSGKIKALRGELRAALARNRGRLAPSDNRRLQAQVTALHTEMGDLAAAARERKRRAG